jgi:hypothetical protein
MFSLMMTEQIVYENECVGEEKCALPQDLRKAFNP